ncbi:MAG TPA: hypothetical protein DCQ26_13280 [Marinilabiliales bacterium]|nr:MAG: hypothetical protein A2W96_16050 [Bacteroidetes bacterium GWD2_40_43]OFX89637.1 MAG: hypothetical protein A2W97_12950 [Bacteroidetes bacterium GWE2_40_63]OFY24155.1 MAG: hypothetical protein A2W88_14385 [Bacteroidetes bacterium GWF2_40_13]OFZ26347.1 MAG: hypothetical protein A2437_03300 [Bacteroidetes bacterium RIFOXYC2_FULL_40_12]HAM99575.1 hypothetical protein [Marinilabiliales bacterium]
MNINKFKDSCSLSDNFSFNDGIWYSSKSLQVSYPKEGYNACFNLEENSFWFRHRNNCIVSLIAKYSLNDLFFDIGGGNGFVTKAIENAGAPVVLVEPGLEGVLNAKRRNVENVFCGTLNDLFELKGQLPTIGTFDVIEHIHDDDRFVKDIHKMLKKDGIFYATVPAYKFLWSDEDTDAGHYRRYSRRSIKKLLKNNNFEIVYSTYLFSILTVPLFVLRTMSSVLGIRKKTKKDNSSEHTQNKGFIGEILNSVWKWELGRIQNYKSIPFGTSCLIVAKKKEYDTL